MSDRLKSAGLAALSFSLSAGLFAIALSPAPASASPLDTQTGYERMTVSLEVADLDLTSTTDQRILDRRIRNAAREMCGSDSGDRVRHGDRLCRLDAVRSTRAQVAGLVNGAERLAQLRQTNSAGSSLAMTNVEVR